MAETKEDNADVGSSSRTQGTQPKSAPAPPGGPKGGYWWGTGRRKSSVARVRIKPGNGKLQINKKQLSDYFKREQDRKAVLAPLQAVGGEKSFDVFVNVRGGGTTGQSGAARLGVARALKNYDENYMQSLRDGGHLTRDGRMVERKKYGQRGARRRFQFSKR
ncbi:MAG: 30S ribosomal protein S9 [Planctomycetota bacterium]|nr:MAG: 30S ribosomal protein S9 [Planctomycetota bacterium]